MIVRAPCTLFALILFLLILDTAYGNYDLIEYGGIWLITIVMTAQGMTAALIAGIIAALSTYAVQSITHHYPIRGVMTAESLRSSRWTRSQAAVAILDDETWGRKRILVLQLQGHVSANTNTDELFPAQLGS